jgi:epoxyqueuosine reductase QueG
MATAMDPGLIRKSPVFDSATTVGIGYSRMAFLVATMAEMISSLGCRAVPMANDTALSIPLAIQAGLGQLGRNGMLLTSSYGACVRLCKVLTDLPLLPDEPSAPALNEACRSCFICATSCPVKAISNRKQPLFETTTVSNNRGILRWPVDPELCYGFWVKNGSDCSTCIARCPMTPQTDKTTTA